MITNSGIGHKGRLGNQMFQYAALIAVAKSTGFKSYLPQSNIQVKPDGCLDIGTQKWIPYSLNIHNYFNITMPFSQGSMQNTYVEMSHKFDDKIFSVKDWTDFIGYFQSWKYFANCQEDIRKEFTFKDEILNQCKSKFKDWSNTVSIHLRRGDFASNPINYVCEPEYYQEALNLLYNIGEKDYRFIICSDDMDYCRKIFGDSEEFYYSVNGTEATDACLMSLCQHHITANSTLGWWSAWLSVIPDKIVITPKNWWADAKLNDNDLLPESWIKI